VVEINKRVRRPELSLNFLSTDDFAGALKQHPQNTHWLFLEPDSHAMLAQFARANVQLENAETVPPLSPPLFRHGGVNLSWSGVYHCPEQLGMRCGDSFS
jgi:hypothetical protein